MFKYFKYSFPEMKAFVTGGSSGLGYYIAKELRNRGYHLILVSSNKERLRAAAKKLDAEYFVLDLSQEYSRAGEILRESNPDILVNNAGIGIYGDMDSIKWKDVEKMLKLNMIALTNLTYEFLKIRKSGYILNISSVASCRPQKKWSAYAASKAYVSHFTRV